MSSCLNNAVGYISITSATGRSRSRSQSPKRSKDNYHRRSYSRSPRRSRRRDDSQDSLSRQRRSDSPLEEEPVTDSFIRAVAAEVRGNGPEYANALKERECDNSKYSFMLNKNVSWDKWNRLVW